MTRPMIVIVFGLLASGALSGCFSEAELGSAQALCPPVENFRAVNNVFERRCGTLDCHGDPLRPFLVFGQTAYRRPDASQLANPNYFPGGLEATTDYEIDGTYESVCGLESEEMDAVIRGEGKLEDLSIVRKPRLQSKHKGGRIWGAGTTAGDRCLLTWIQGTLDVEACKNELEVP
jgi:hypothetical protein